MNIRNTATIIIDWYEAFTKDNCKSADELLNRLEKSFETVMSEVLERSLPIPPNYMIQLKRFKDKNPWCNNLATVLMSSKNDIDKTVKGEFQVGSYVLHDNLKIYNNGFVQIYGFNFQLLNHF